MVGVVLVVYIEIAMAMGRSSVSAEVMVVGKMTLALNYDVGV